MKTKNAEARLAALAAEIRSAGLAGRRFSLDELAEFTSWPPEDREARNRAFTSIWHGDKVHRSASWDQLLRERGRIYRAIRVCRWAHPDWHFARAETFEPMRCYVNSETFDP